MTMLPLSFEKAHGRGQPSNRAESLTASPTNSTSASVMSHYQDAVEDPEHGAETETNETRDFIMAKRMKESEIVGNQSSLNPLQAPFAYMDGSLSFGEELKLVGNGIKTLFSSNHRQLEDTGLHESVDKQRMHKIEQNIQKLEQLQNRSSIERRNSSNNSSVNVNDTPNLIESIKSEMELENMKENSIIQSLNHNSEPVTLPNRGATWEHSNREQYLQNSNLRLSHINALTNNDTIQNSKLKNLYLNELEKMPTNAPKFDPSDPQLMLNEKNDKKTAFMVDAILLGFANTLCLTSSFLKEENGFRKGTLITPLLSLCLTDITNDVFLSKMNLKQNEKNIANNAHNLDGANHDNSKKNRNRTKNIDLDSSKENDLLSPLNEDDLLKLAIFCKNRIFRLHLEYGLGDHVLRWDIEKDTKALLNLHKKLIKKNTKDRIDRSKRKDPEIPRFPTLSNHVPKFRGLFKGEKEVLISNETNNENTNNSLKKPRSILSNISPNINSNSDSINEEALNTDSVVPIPNSLAATTSANSSNSESVRSLHSATHALSRFSTVAFENFEKMKDKVKDKTKESDNEKERDRQKAKERHALLIQERIRLNKKYNDDMQCYFDSLFDSVAFKEQTTKVLQFFELSPFSLLLSNEIYRKRKEGYLFIVSSASKQGWRVGHFRLQDLGEMIKRHTAKWCILGDSFLIYTSDITSTTPEEVFLIDSKVQITMKGLSNHSDKKVEDDFGDTEYDNYNINDDYNMNNDEENDNYFQNPNSVLKSAKSYPTIKLTNSERTIKLVSINPKVTVQWASSLRNIINETEWSKSHRFNSFAPIRHNAFAQWFVDARDYWYAASSAIEMAKDVIYIHDWWLSPELYLRRPANGNQNWRIDRLLEKKANQGVKIFIIIYRNVGTTVVTDSMYTKHSLLDLHENIYVLRSPNQIMQNVLFWAHHEKLLIIDHSICFLGGIDLCFGRYDTPDHVLVDDTKYAFEVKKSNEQFTDDLISKPSRPTIPINSTIPTPETLNHTGTTGEEFSEDKILDDENNMEYDFQRQFQIFPGKDYSNPRKKDFFELTSPHSDMYDRQAIPRMPWHDVHMVTGGQVARDLSRHFIQRWNYLLRQKRPSRPTPLLVPPRPFTDEELTKLNLKGKCEVQILRSSGDWSLGLKEHEQSIQNAYIKCIEQSEHFVYIENQFFITSCTIDGTVVKNEIGNALVDRIITAHKNDEVWKAVIVIPLMPGFEADVDTKEGGSVRLIMQCQYMSISMGETSIFARLRRVGIRPEEYINFYSLRKWGLISDKKLLTTEQLYIHAKTMIVDDRIAIIGSANINERSMRGSRDSEICAIVRDKDLIESKMDGKKYHVGKFSHSLRVRLMREHLGVDVDLLELVERRFYEIEKFCQTPDGLKAAVLKPNMGKQSLSAMVEMGTRYLLGLSNGTPGFNERYDGFKYEKYKDALTKNMISSFKNIKTETDMSRSLDDIEFSFSFNHRAGNENTGLRSDKNFSSDTRVANESHRNEVKGEFDGYNSRYFNEAKKQINRFLVTKVNQCLPDNSYEDCTRSIKKTPLPDYEDIVEVLSQHIVKNATKKEQNSINVDRWTMIKRLFYMKKLYSKLEMNKQQNSSRCLLTSHYKQKQNRTATGVEAGSIGVEMKDSRANQNVFGDSELLPQGNASDQSKSRNNSSSPMEDSLITADSKKKTRIPDIPLIRLTNDDINDIDKNLLPNIDHEFIDPYGFEDPLDITFYEGTWLSQAIRNTLLFQMVFHVQPDDMVQTWMAYKDFEEKRNAFDIYQNLYTGNLNMNDLNRETVADKNKQDSAVDLVDGFSNHDVEEHRRRLERNAKLAELERFQRIGGGQAGINIAGANGYSRGVVYDYQSSLRLMRMVRGHVVMFPTRWLKKEVEGSNWFYKADKIPPIQIYN